jgi:hypothetical protein
VPTRTELLDHLVRHDICGDVATPRQSNLANARRCADGEEKYTFGLRFRRSWTYSDIVALMADRVGVSPDLDRTDGPDRIDPRRCLDRLDDLADRLAAAAARRERVLFGTGHPSGLLAIHVELAAALAARGCEVLRPAAGVSYTSGPVVRHLRHVGGVAMVSRGGGLDHTHSAEPMRLMLADLDGAPPDLVVADHGFAGAAGQAGVDSVGFADSNDPALFVGEAEGSVRVAVPLDDNVLPHLYAPVTRYLLDRLDRRGG